MMEFLFNAMTNEKVEDKLDFLNTAIAINTSILLAVVGLVFLLYQIDKYSKFKRINYIYLFSYISLGLAVGLLYPITLLHTTGGEYSHLEKIMYIVSVLSPFIMILLSVMFLAINLYTSSTRYIVKRFAYRDKIDLKARVSSILENVKASFSKKDEKKKRRNKSYSIGRTMNPVARQSQELCLQHGVVMQEVDAVRYSSLHARDDLLVRMALTAIEEDDSKTLRLIIKRYAKLLKATSGKQLEEYSEDLEAVTATLIRYKKDEVYNLLVDILSDEWLKDTKSLEVLDDELGRVYVGALYQYVDKGEDVDTIQRSLSLLLNFFFLILVSANKKDGKDWFYTKDFCRIYARKAVLRVAEKNLGYTLWLAHEKAHFFLHHGAEIKKMEVTIEFMKLDANIGILGRVYELHCESGDCSKTVYQHVLEAFQMLGDYSKDTFTKKASEYFLRDYKESFEKLIGFEIELDMENHEYTEIKTKPKIMHSVKLGPTPETSDSQNIDYSQLDKKSVAALMRSRKGGW